MLTQSTLGPSELYPRRAHAVTNSLFPCHTDILHADFARAITFSLRAGVPTRYGRRHLAAATHVEVTVLCDDGVSVAGVVALGADGIDGVYQRLAAAGCRMND